MLCVESHKFKAITPAFNSLHLQLASPLTVILFEFCWDFWHQKTRVSRLSCNIICMILCLTILIKHWLVSDRWIDRHMTTADIQTSYLASMGKSRKHW